VHLIKTNTENSNTDDTYRVQKSPFLN